MEDQKTGLDVVIQNLVERFTVQLELVECGKIVGLSESASRTARHRKNFPVKSTKINGRVVVFTHHLIDYLRNGVNGKLHCCLAGLCGGRSIRKIIIWYKLK